MRRKITLNKETIQQVVDTYPTKKEMCKVLNISLATLKTYCQKFNINFIQKETQESKVKNLILQGKSNSDIVKIIGCYSGYVSLIRNRYNLSPCNSILPKTIWEDAQQYYDQGHSLREVSCALNIPRGSLNRAALLGKIKTRGYSESQKIARSKFTHKHSEETKQIIREKHIKYMQQNPEKTAWSRRWKHEKSWPEKIFEDELIRRGIKGWVYNFRAGIYQYDFGFPDLKLDIEIDGKWHDTEKQRLKDRLRDEYTLMNGWIVIRFTAKEVQCNLTECVDKLEGLIKQHGHVGELV